MIKLNIKKNIHWILLISILTQSSFAVERLSPYSTSELDQLEKEFIQQINQSESVERNPLAFQYINHIGKNLAEAGHIKPPDFLL